MDLPNCIRPETFEISNVGTTSVDVHWFDTIASTWVIAYGPAGFTLGGPSTLYQDFYDTLGTITGLTPNTPYDFYLMAVCGSDTSWNLMRTTFTACDYIDSLPFTQDFEYAATGSTTSASFVNCMQRLNNGSTYFGYPYVSNSNVLMPSEGLIAFKLDNLPPTGGEVKIVTLRWFSPTGWKQAQFYYQMK